MQGPGAPERRSTLQWAPTSGVVHHGMGLQLTGANLESHFLRCEGAAPTDTQTSGLWALQSCAQKC